MSKLYEYIDGVAFYPLYHDRPINCNRHEGDKAQEKYYLAIMDGASDISVVCQYGYKLGIDIGNIGFASTMNYRFRDEDEDYIFTYWRRGMGHHEA